MNFFEHQLQAKKKTKLLIAYFVLAVIFIIGALFFVVSMLTGSSHFEADVFYITALCTVIIITLGSLYKIIRLRSGGHVVAESLGGRRISLDTQVPSERKILNVVEEIAIASGMPVPPVYLLDESGINAFAAGYTYHNAVIGVTRGCIELLTRDELQGVVAHEFSHILHGDMRLNIRLIGILNGILIIGMTGYFILRSSLRGSRYRSSDDSKGRAGFLLFGAALYVIGYIGVFFGRLIKAAISRQREFLADASAVQYTRNPSGIAGALKKIGGYASGSKIKNSHAEEASHLFFSPAMSFFLNLLATHPPLSERIQKIDPSFQGEFSAVTPPHGNIESEFAAGLSGLTSSTNTLNTTDIVSQIGDISASSIELAGQLLQTLPSALQQACKDAQQAQFVVYALLLSKYPPARDEQMLILDSHGVQSLKVREFHTILLDLPELYLLPLIDLALPVLKTLPTGEFETFEMTLQQLAKADKEITLFEYMLHHILKRLVSAQAETREKSLSNSDFYRYALIVLHCVADVGNSDALEKDNALNAAINILSSSNVRAHMSTREYSLNDLDDALSKLSRESYPRKEVLISATVKAISADGAIKPAEYHILRTLCDALGCPVPLSAGMVAPQGT